MKIDLVTPCKGRLQHWKKTLLWNYQLVKDFGLPFEVVAVAYKDPEALAWVLDNQEDREALTVVDVQVHAGHRFFSLPRARNIGASAGSGSVICFADADTRLSVSWLKLAVRQVSSGSPVFCTAGRYRSLCLVPRTVFDVLRGFDEEFSNYGAVTEEFYLRARLRFNPVIIPSEGVIMLETDENHRLTHYRSKAVDSTGRPASEAVQLRLALKANRVINQYVSPVTYSVLVSPRSKV